MSHHLRFSRLYLLAFFAFMALGLNVAWAAKPTAAEASGYCKTPREALFTVLYWQNWQKNGRDNPQKAAACLDRSRLANPEKDAPNLAVNLQQYIEESGVTIRWDDIPVDPDYKDAQGNSTYAVYPEQGLRIELTLIRGRWLVSASSLALLPSIDLAPVAWIHKALPSFMRFEVLGVEVWQLLGLVLLFLVGLLVRSLLLWIFRIYARQAAKRTSLWWLERGIERASLPLAVLSIAGVIMAGLPFLAFPIGFTGILIIATRSLATYAVVWLAYREVDVFTEMIDRRRLARANSKLDAQLPSLINKTLKLTLWCLGFVFILQNLHVDVGSLVAGLGLGGLAFALAAKDTVANLFGSAMIFLDKPFQIGDFVSIPPNIEGVVEEVGFRTTRIRTFYHSLVAVPNANIAAAAVDNYGARRYRRYRTVIRLVYGTQPAKIEAFCEAIRAAILANPKSRRDLFAVDFIDFGQHGLEILVYTFWEVPDWLAELREKTNLNLEIMRIAETIGVSFALPTQVLHIASTPEHPLTPESGVSIEELQRRAVAFGPEGEHAMPSGYGIRGKFEAIPAEAPPRIP